MSTTRFRSRRSTRNRSKRCARCRCTGSPTRRAWHANNPAAAGLLGRTVNALTPGVLRGDAARGLWRRVVYRPQRAPDKAFMRELRLRVKPEVEAVSDYLGRDLVTDWGYDRLG